MKLVSKIISLQVSHLFSFNNRIYFHEYDNSGRYAGLYSFNNGEIKNHDIKLFYWGHQVDDLFFWQPENGSGLTIFNKNLEIVKKIKGEIYFASIRQSFENKLKINVRTKGKTDTYLINDNYEWSHIDYFYEALTNRGYVGKIDRQNIVCQSSSKELLWQTNISKLIQNLILGNGEFQEIPIEINGKLSTNGDVIFVPISRNYLVALNAYDGSLKWISSSETSIGYCTYYAGIIYNNSGKTLEEINPENGEILRKITYKDFSCLENYISMTGEHKVYSDFIILKDQIKGYVIMLDRYSLKLVEFLEIGEKLPSDADYIHWCNHELYVLVREKLYIFK